jgi:hypothetical protein
MWTQPNAEYGSHTSGQYGRQRERLVLLTAYHKVLQTKRSGTVVVHAESGQGETTLVDLLHEPVVASQGYFCVGKFFQNSAVVQEPFSAVMAAFLDLCDLVSQSENGSEQRRSEIQRALGSDGHLPTHAISNISPFLPPRSIEDTDIAAETSLAKFRVACKAFLQAMASDDVESRPFARLVVALHVVELLNAIQHEGLLSKVTCVGNLMWTEFSLGSWSQKSW